MVETKAEVSVELRRWWNMEQVASLSSWKCLLWVAVVQVSFWRYLEFLGQTKLSDVLSFLLL